MIGLTELLKNRKLAWGILIVSFLITIFFAKYARIDRIDNRLEDNVLPGEELEAYYRFLEVFGNDRILLAAFPTPNIDNELVRKLFKTELELLKHPNVQTVLSPVSPLRSNIGIQTLQDFDSFLEDNKQLNKYIENLKKTESFNRLIVSADWKIGGMVIRLKSETGDLVGSTLSEVKEIINKNMPPGTRITGIPEITRLIIDMTRRDQKMFSPLTILLMAIYLMYTYGSISTVFLPLYTMIADLIWTKGTMMASGNSINFVTSMLAPMIMSIALTYIIHVMTEYFESSRHVETFDPEILAKAIIHVHEPFIISALAVAIGFGSLIYQSIPSIAQFGTYSTMGDVLATILTFFIIPAGLVVFKNTGKQVRQVKWLEYDLEKLTRFLITNPFKVSIAIVILLGVSFYGIYILPIETSLIRFLPPHHEIQDINHYVEQNLCGIVPIEVLLESTGPRWTEVEMVQRVRHFQEEVASTPYLDRSLSYVDLIQDFDRMFSDEPNHVPKTEEEIYDYLSFYSSGVATDPEDVEDSNPKTASNTVRKNTYTIKMASFTPFVAGGMLGEFIASSAMTTHISLRLKDRSSRELVESFEIIKTLMKKHFSDLPVKATLTGRAAMWAEVTQNIAYNEITSFTMSFTIITLLMAVFFRSLKVGVAAIIPNIVPVLFTYGCMGLAGTPFSTATGMIASIAIGLSVDDTIHILCQYRYELSHNIEEMEAIVRTMVHKGRATFLTMVPLFAGFFVLTLSDFAPTKYFGIFISIGVGLDLICELLVTPIVLLAMKPFPIPHKTLKSEKPSPESSTEHHSH
ncbi:MAG: MMPL family transporter [Candidatus Riflebacteria bacterium]|nr:MMPL family transporter [Candidatus Riflebacteria bacterium]